MSIFSQQLNRDDCNSVMEEVFSSFTSGKAAKQQSKNTSLQDKLLFK